MYNYVYSLPSVCPFQTKACVDTLNSLMPLLFFMLQQSCMTLCSTRLKQLINKLRSLA